MEGRKLEHQCTIKNMDNQKCHAYNNGECMNGVVCKPSQKTEAEKIIIDLLNLLDNI